MHRRLAVFMLLTLVVRPASIPDACGDKFLIGARGASIYRSMAGSGAAAILIYARKGSAADTVVINEDAAEVLNREGYRARSVTDADALRQAMSAEAWDLVLVDAADAASAASGLRGEHPATVLPVLAKPTAAALTSARQQFTLVMKGPLKTQAFVNAIGDSLEKRYKAIERAEKAAKAR